MIPSTSPLKTLSDYEFNQIRGMTGLFSVRTWALLYGLILKRDISDEEVLDAHRRQYTPEQLAEAKRIWDGITRSESPAWRAQI